MREDNVRQKRVKIMCALPVGGDPDGGGGFLVLPTLMLFGGEYA